MGRLARVLGFRDLLLLFVGTVIGSGIFLTPGLVLRRVAGSVGVSLLAWLAGGLLSLLGALTYAELAARNPEAGGLYCYIRDGFGKLPAFLYGWCLFLVIASGSVAALARAFSRYLAEVIPMSPAGSTMVAVGVVGVVTVVNVWGTRKSSDLQNWTTLIKVVMVLLSSMALVSFGKHAGELASALRPKNEGISLLSNFGVAMIAVLWAYEGWQFGTYSAGEVMHPQKDFPRAFLTGSLVLMGLYVIAVIAYFVALGPERAGASEAIATASVLAVLGRKAGFIVSVAILISTFSAANGTILTASRVHYAMAQDNLFFRKVGEVHPRFQTPAVAVVCLGVWSAILASVGSFGQLIGGVIFVGWVFYGLGAAAIFQLRRQGPVEELPYRVPWYPLTPVLFVLAASALVFNSLYVAFNDPRGFRHIAIALALFALGVPAYCLRKLRLT